MCVGEDDMLHSQTVTNSTDIMCCQVTKGRGMEAKRRQRSKKSAEKGKERKGRNQFFEIGYSYLSLCPLCKVCFCLFGKSFTRFFPSE